MKSARSILIIGGNSDIGYATSRVFAKNKYDIHLASRDIVNLKIKKNELEFLYNISCKISFLDIENKNNINHFFDQNLKSPNIILLTAGLLEKGNVNKEQVLSINYQSQVTFIEKLISKYESQKKLSTIIGISSVAGDRKKKNNNAYSLSKSFFNLYLKELNEKLKPSGIHVMTVKPGWVNTKMTKNINLPKIMTVSPDFVGDKIFEAYKNKKKILYAPQYWSVIMFLYRLIPNILFSIFKK